ncbi:probable E3 ubiquitin-protein ligase HERC4 isoform X1 [Ooceraea biroi]|nr:probable E3 ubiquitin-protein ligase HERC4 isoform X1 [Ooceraea biroi]
MSAYKTKKKRERSVEKKCSIDQLSEEKQFKFTWMMFGWGSTIHGELGLGGIEAENIFMPRAVEFTETENIEQISCGENHTVIVTKDGRVYSCGNNDYGQLGHEKTRKRFQLVSGLEAFVFKMVACGFCHTLGINEWGQLFSWGSNGKGQLGLNSTDSIERVPHMIKTLATKTVVQVACGVEHSVALTNDGEVYSWGSNMDGQLGLGSNVGCELKPTRIPALAAVPIVFIACGGHHTIAISKSGVVYAWGLNTFGQLGLNDDINRSGPFQLPTLRNAKVCYAACGEEFSVFLTIDGGVFTCGAGMYGQLGHGTNTTEILPRQVMELMGSTVTQICCGKKHTLALVPSRGRVYAWGLGGVGQLGNRIAQSATTPQVVLGPWASPSGSSAVLDPYYSPQLDCVVKHIYCGGDHCLATVTSRKDNIEPDDCRILGPSYQVLTVTEEKLIECQKIPPGMQVNHELMTYIETVFRSQACINASFLLANDQHYGCSSKNHGIDIECAIKLFGIIAELENNTIQELIFTCITESLIPTFAVSPPDVETLRVYVTLPLYHGFANLSNYKCLQAPFCKALVSLKEESRQTVSQWWGNTSKYYFERLVRIYKTVMLQFLKESTVNKRITWNENLRYVLEMLSILNKRNNADDRIVPHETFYMPEITEYIDIHHDYLNWLMDELYYRKIYLCNYAFIFDVEAKTTLLQLDQSLQMRGAMQEAATRAVREMLSGVGNLFVAHNSQFLTLLVSREDIVANTLAQLPHYNSSDLKKPLRVKFNGEEAEDVGGVKKEFFMLLWRELLDPKYGMFKEYEESRKLWFNSDSLEDTDMFTLIGILCGLAIYNATIINLPFPKALYKKLLNEAIDLSDMEDLSPIMAKSMESILNYNKPDFEVVFCLNFEIVRDVFGEQKIYELIPGGSKIPVALKNKQQYVDLYVDYIFNKSVELQYKAFDDGFHKVCGGRLLQLFHSHELMSLMVGNENYDWKQLEMNTTYKDDYFKEHPTIVLFWQVFHELPLEEKKKFLLFLTGTDRIPIQGMKVIKITIQPMSDERFLPAAHTCFNLLDLPRYKTRERLKYKLLQAIQHNEGFSLV